MTSETTEEVRVFLARASENLASATANYEARRYNACANRAYYACFRLR